MNIVGLERDGIIVVHLPLGFEAKDVVQIDAVEGTVEVDQVVGAGKGLVVLGDVGFFQEAIGGGDGADAVPAQRFRAYPKTPAARKVMYAQVRWRKAS